MLPRHIGGLVQASDPRIAPDARRVAYTRHRVDLAANRSRSAVWVAPIDGAGAPDGEPTALSPADADASLGRWSPDGTRIAYAVTSLDDDAHGAALRVRVVASGDEFSACETPSPISELEWSPDSTQLAFVAREPNPDVYGSNGSDGKAKDTPA